MRSQNRTTYDREVFFVARDENAHVVAALCDDLEDKVLLVPYQSKLGQYQEVDTI